MRRKPTHKLQREIDDLDVNLDALDSEVDTKTQVDDSAAESIDDTYSASKIEERISEHTHSNTAVTISFTPTGNIAATNVQTAIAEVDSEKPVLGETLTTAYRGDRGKTAYDHSQAAHAPSDADNTASAIDASNNVTTLSPDAKIGNVDGAALQHIRYEDLYNQMRDELKNYFDSIYTPL